MLFPTSGKIYLFKVKIETIEKGEKYVYRVNNEDTRATSERHQSDIHAFS